MFYWILGLFAIAGAILGFFACGLWLAAFDLRRNGIHIEGTIKDVETGYVNVGSEDRDTTLWCFPIVSFTTTDGREIVAKSQTGFPEKRSPQIKPGGKLRIVYRKDSPMVWSVDDWLSVYVVPLVLGISSLVCFLVAFLMLKGGHPS